MGDLWEPPRLCLCSPVSQRPWRFPHCRMWLLALGAMSSWCRMGQDTWVLGAVLVDQDAEDQDPPPKVGIAPGEGPYSALQKCTKPPWCDSGCPYLVQLDRDWTIGSVPIQVWQSPWDRFIFLLFFFTSHDCKLGPASPKWIKS